MIYKIKITITMMITLKFTDMIIYISISIIFSTVLFHVDLVYVELVQLSE